MARIVEEIVLKTTIKMDGSDKYLRDLNNITNNYTKINNTTINNHGFKDLDDELKLAYQDLNRYVRSLDTANQKTNVIASGTSKFASALTAVKYAVVGIGLKKLIEEASDVAKSYDRIDKRLQTVFGSQAAAGAQMQMVTEWSEKLGLSLTATANGYAKISASARGTSLEGKGVEQIFKSVTMASTALGMSAQEQESALRAISQMMSKGKVQAEELRGQLGDAGLDGAFQIAARAMNMTTSELDKFMEEGKLLAEDFLPKFASQLEKEFAGSAENAATSMQANANRMRNAWEDAIKGMGEATMSFAPILTSLIQQFSEGVEEFKALYDAIHSTGAFDPSNDFELTRGRTADENALLEQQAKARLQSKKDAEEEMRIRAEQLKIEEAMKRVKSLDDFALKMQESTISDRIAEKAGLTRMEYEKLKPAITKAIEASASEAEIIESVLANVKLFKDELNAVKAPNLEPMRDPLYDMLKSATELKRAMDMSKELNLTNEEFDKVKGALGQAISLGMGKEEISAYIEGLREVGAFDEAGKKKKTSEKFDGRIVATALQVGTEQASEFLKGNEVLFNQLDVQKELLKETKKGNKNSPMIVTKES